MKQRVKEFYLGCMQKKPAKAVSHAEAPIHMKIAVTRIHYDRVSDGRKVFADLVLSASFDFGFYKGQRWVRRLDDGENFVIGTGGNFSAGFACFEQFGNGFSMRDAFYKNEIFFARPARLEDSFKCLPISPKFAKEQHARGFIIEAVEYIRLKSRGLKMSFCQSEGRFLKRIFFRRNTCHARRFVYGKKKIVFVENGKRAFHVLENSTARLWFFWSGVTLRILLYEV